MIKKLRLKIIATGVLSVLMVLVIILGAINIMNYVEILEDADSILGMLAENDGTFPEAPKEKQGEKEMVSKELPYESRYFHVLVDHDGNAVESDISKVVSVNSEIAGEMAEEVYQRSAEKGFESVYRYIKTEQEDGTLIIFLDCSRSISTFRTFLGTSISISLLGIAAVFVLVTILSKKILRPFVENYEKQKRFITDAGHEIKTPLTIIDADTDVMEMEIGENEWLEDIRKQTVRLKELTNDLIYLARLEENQNTVQPVEFPISDLAMEYVQSFQAPAKMQNKNFHYKIEPMLSYCGDAKNIQRLFSVLLDNALKYSDERGEISFTLEKKGKNICIIVYNTAENIDVDTLPHFFDRFYRGDPSRNSQISGYGIGLSIAKAIVTAHRGKISAASQDGKSLTVTVLLGDKM